MKKYINKNINIIKEILILFIYIKQFYVGSFYLKLDIQLNKTYYFYIYIFLLFLLN